MNRSFPFHKYHGTGNDFIIIDDRSETFPDHETAVINKLCHRRFGIGADGLILLRNDAETDFRMLYFNANGKEGSMCGNGGRCVVHFAHSQGIIESQTSFIAVDGLHEAEVLPDKTIKLKMQDVSNFLTIGDADYDIDTGSPHYVQFHNSLDDFDAYQAGREIRYSEPYKEKGINVNFVQLLSENRLKVITYERGVEDLTYSCGTGVVACCLMATENFPDLSQQQHFYLDTQGGSLQVSFERPMKGVYKNIWLIGPAVCSFTGRLTLA